MANENIVILGESNFEEIVSKPGAPVLVDFWAAWCGPCRTLAPTLEKLAKEYGDKLVVCKLNVDENVALAQRFNVMSIPTVIIFNGGRATETIVGVRNAQDYKSLIDKYTK